jgi:hypothetical protein
MYDPGYKGREYIAGKAGDPLEYMTEEELKHMRALYAGEVIHYQGKRPGSL